MRETRGPTFVDLFSGCGGLSLGFLNAGYQGLLAVDRDPYAVRVYNDNLKGKFDSGAVIADLSKLSSRGDVLRFLEDHHVYPGDVDVVVGGPPCQSYSVVGRNKIKALMEADGNLEEYWNEKNKERISLFNVYAYFLEVLEPKWFLFENVPAIQSHQSYKHLMDRFNSLRSISGKKLIYNITPANYWASDFGVPQRRRRFVMVGLRTELSAGNWRPPEKVDSVTVEQAIGDLPEVEHGHKTRRIQYMPRRLTQYQKKMRRGVPAEDENIITDHICRWHNPDDVKLFARMNPGARFADEEVQRAMREINPNHKLIKYSSDKFKDKLHKLDPQKPSWTVTAHLQKDGYKFIHYSQSRTISVREAARLQSFPDWFSFGSVSMVRAFGLIGNAVPPLMAEAFARSFIINDNE